MEKYCSRSRLWCKGCVSCTTSYILRYWRYWYWRWKTVLWRNYDKLPWKKNHHSGFSHCRILLLPAFFPQVLIIHKYHWLPTPTLSQGLPPGNPGCSRTQREFPLCAWRKKDSVPNMQPRFYYTVCCFLIPDFSGPPPSSVFWENSVCLIRSTLESFLSSVFLCCLSSSLLLVLAIMVIAIS